MHEYFLLWRSGLKKPNKIYSAFFLDFIRILQTSLKSNKKKQKLPLPLLTSGPHPQWNRGSRGSPALPRPRPRDRWTGKRKRNWQAERQWRVLKRWWWSSARRVATPTSRTVEHWQNREGAVTVSKEIELLLTVQNLKFHIGTRISAKIGVVEEKMLYNFAFGQKLIRGSNQGEKTRSKTAKRTFTIRT